MPWCVPPRCDFPSAAIRIRHALVKGLAESLHVFFKFVISLILQATYAKRMCREPRAAILLENFKNFFPPRAAVKKRCQRANVERMGPEPEQMAGNSLQLGEYRSNHSRAKRRLCPE